MNGSLDLNGEWQLGWADGVRGIPALAERDEVDAKRFFAAQVPGEVHLDLERAGLIEDVRLGINALRARWVEEYRWIYRKEFDAPAEALSAPAAWLTFEGLDLTARIVLNGQEIGQHQNSYYPCQLNVTGKLRAGKNVLVVHLNSGVLDVADKALGRYQYGAEHKITKRHWLRKAGCQFGWDWSIRLLNVGIFKSVRLEWAMIARVDQTAVAATVTPDLKRGTVKARMFVESLRDAKGTIALSVGEKTHTQEIALRAGLHAYETSINIDNPTLWWPAEVGAQHRYPVRVALSIDGAKIGEHSTKIGFRHICILQEPDPKGGRFFILEVNNRKVFAKGANWASGDMIFARCDRERYQKLLGLAREAHFNFFRINGCGIYEFEEFYDVCDELGIMIWQDFPFTNTHYPLTDPEFLAAVQVEARWNIRRLQSRPSLVVWCGNNEMEWLGGAEKTRGTEIDDMTFFDTTLAKIVAEEDPTRYYQRSSPCSPDGLDPNSDLAGNQHPWSLGFKDNDIHKYRGFTSRFAVEGGILGAPALPTLRASLAPGQEFPWSFSWQQHDNSVSVAEHPSFQDQMILDWMGQIVPQLSLEDYCYWAGVFQGEGLREYADNYRRRMFDSAAAAFWDFNDFWPVTRGWAIVDPYFRRAPAFHAVKRAFAPISIVVVSEGDDVIVFGVNDTDSVCAGALRYGVFDFAGEYPVDQTADVKLAANASTRLATFPRSRWTRPESIAAFAVLSQGGKTIARNRMLLKRFKDLRWPKAQVSVKHAFGRATFESPTFAWAVCLDLSGEQPMSDNFFDVYPGQPHVIEWPSQQSPRILKVGNLSA